MPSDTILPADPLSHPDVRHLRALFDLLTDPAGGDPAAEKFAERLGETSVEWTDGRYFQEKIGDWYRARHAGKVTWSDVGRLVIYAMLIFDVDHAQEAALIEVIGQR